MGNSASHFERKKPSEKKQPTSSGKVCYYELLGVSEHATAEDLKKAYRQKALQLHPDKNQHRIAEATEEFTAVQHAYQTLSDPHERAWYDRNKERIIGDAADEEDAPGVEELMHFFQPGVYKGFEDTPNGFFSVYRELFEYLEEYEVEDGELGRGVAYTSFGSKNTPYHPSLAAFYDKWLSFQSTRKFLFVEKYSEEYADNRRVRRAMAKENQKLRDQQRKQYSETVRELASFIQKRDPRFKKYQEERKKEREESEKQRKKEQKQKRAQALQDFVQPEWSQDVDDEKLADLLDHMETNCSDGTEGSSEDEEIIFECIVCKKYFKNQQQWLNHCQSNKHKSNVSKLGYDPYAFDFENEEDQSDKEEIESDKEAEALDEPESQLVDNNEINEISEGSIIDDIMNQNAHETEKIKEEPISSKILKQPKKPRRRPKEERTSTNELKCNVCGGIFESRNQLFKHIEDEGHAETKSGKKSSSKKK